jgi:prepilin-type N-terminal cleavage/methylation domain-containing protein
MFLKSLTCYRHREGVRSRRGFSLLELMIVVAITMTVMAYAVPKFLTAYYTVRLKAACADLSGLMQKGRIQAARENSIFQIVYTAGTQETAFVDMNNDQAWNNPKPTVNGVPQTEPGIYFGPTITMATGAPNGSGGAPTPYVLVGDSSTTNYDNATTLGWSARGLPCAYVAPTCATPSAGYFVYYVKDQRPTGTGWGAVVVTRSGRTKVVTWNGAAWQ